MKLILFVFSIALCVPAAAQTGSRATSRIDLVTKPPSPAWGPFGGWQQDGKNPGGGTVIHRIATDLYRRVYSGYDLVMEPQKDDPASILVTVRPLSENYSGRPAPTEWTFSAPPDYPAPRVIQDGDTVEVTLFVKPETGQQAVDSVTFDVRGPLPTLELEAQRKLVELMRLSVASQVGYSAPPITHIPFNEERAREFSGENPDMRIWHPYVSLNGLSVSSTPGRSVEGPLPWFYLPNRGRYILSLLPRESLGFIKAGETRGSAITFTLGDDTIELWTSVSIAPGDSPSILYVLHDPDWAPTSSSQQDRFLLGTVDPGEVEAMRKK